MGDAVRNTGSIKLERNILPILLSAQYHHKHDLQNEFKSF